MAIREFSFINKRLSGNAFFETMHSFSIYDGLSGKNGGGRVGNCNWVIYNSTIFRVDFFSTFHNCHVVKTM